MSRQPTEKELHEEAVHFCEVYHAFAQYGKSGIASIHYRQVDVERVPPHHKELLEKVVGYPQRLKSNRNAVLKNHTFIKAVLESASAFFTEDIVSESMRLGVSLTRFLGTCFEA
jgi:carnosine N-methyltransferase